MKTKFVDKGIPVIMGEYGAYRRNGSNHIPLDPTWIRINYPETFIMDGHYIRAENGTRSYGANSF